MKISLTELMANGTPTMDSHKDDTWLKMKQKAITYLKKHLTYVNDPTNPKWKKIGQKIAQSTEMEDIYDTLLTDINNGNHRVTQKMCDDIFDRNLKEISLPRLFGLTKLNEYSEKIIKMLKDRYKKQSTNLDDAMIEYYISRFDQIKASLKQKVKAGDQDKISKVPKDLLNGDRYLDILQWKKWHDLEIIVDSFPAPPSTQKAALKTAENDAETDANEIYNQNGLEIYKGDSQHSCIKYGHGKGNAYSWCISRPGTSSYYPNYRFMGEKSRMFYFIFDRTRSSARKGGDSSSFIDKFHAIVIHVFENGSWAITDADNPGEDVVSSFEKLASHMPADLWAKIKPLKELFTYVPPTQDEKELAALSGKKLTLEQFAELRYSTKLAYINGKNVLTPEQIGILDVDLKNQYINMGNPMPFATLKDNLPLVKRYITVQFRRQNKPVATDYLEYMTEEDKEDYYKKYAEEEWVTYEHIEKYFPQYLGNNIDTFLEHKYYMPDSWYKHMNPRQKMAYDVYGPVFVNSDVQSWPMKETDLISYFLLPKPMTAEQFRNIDPRLRPNFIEFIKTIKKSGQLSENGYFSIFAAFPKENVIKGDKLYVAFTEGSSKIWLDEIGKTINSDSLKEQHKYDDWGLHLMRKRSGIIK